MQSVKNIANLLRIKKLIFGNVHVIILKLHIYISQLLDNIIFFFFHLKRESVSKKILESYLYNSKKTFPYVIHIISF